MAGMHKPETSSPDERPEPNGKQPDWVSWKTERGIAKELGTSATYIRRLVARMMGAPYRAPDGTNRYSPAFEMQVREFLEAAQELAEDEDTPAPKESKAAAEATLLRTLNESLNQARAHNERLISIICGPVERILASYDDHQGRLQERLTQLELARDASQTAREEQHERMHERELEAKIVTSSLQRKDKLFGQLEQRLPAIFAKLEQSVLFKDSRVSGATSATLEFLKKLDPIQIQALLSPDVPFLNAEQQGLVRKIFEEAGMPVPSASQPSEPTDPKKEK